MRGWLFFALLVLTVNLHGQSLLWKITGPDLPAPSYLFGTHHMAPLSVLDHIEGYPEAFKQVRQVIGEVNRDSMTLGKIWHLGKEAIYMPKDTTLGMLLTDEEYRLVDDTVRKYLKKNLSQLSARRPMFIAQELTGKFHGKYVPRPKMRKMMDVWFQKQGKRKGYSIIGLDNVALQFQRMQGIPLKSQAQELVTVAKNPDGLAAFVDTLMHLYLTFDLERLEQLFGGSLDIGYAIERNRAWMEKLPSYIQAKPSFIAVGLGHLIGETGLINQFRQLGYTVEPVK